VHDVVHLAHDRLMTATTITRGTAWAAISASATGFATTTLGTNIQVTAIRTAAFLTGIIAVAITRLPRWRMTFPIAVIGFAASTTGVRFATAMTTAQTTTTEHVSQDATVILMTHAASHGKTKQADGQQWHDLTQTHSENPPESHVPGSQKSCARSNDRVT
jgi:hypothetical protein